MIPDGINRAPPQDKKIGQNLRTRKFTLRDEGPMLWETPRIKTQNTDNLLHTPLDWAEVRSLSSQMHLVLYLEIIQQRLQKVVNF